MKITVIGEANIDISVVPQGNGTSLGCTPARIRFHHGGVARNIAHNLSLLGHQVSLMTILGGDDFAQGMADECRSLGIDLSLSSVFAQEQSPIFLSFNDETGNMQSAHSDVGLNDRMDLDWLAPKMDDIDRAEIVVADTLLTSDALAHLIDHCEAPLYLDAVSPKRAVRIIEALEKSKKKTLFALKCNLGEAQAMTGENDAFESYKTLNNKGISNVFLTMGSNGAIYCTENKPVLFPSLPVEVVNVTGSGDAFFAGVIHAHASGLGGKEAVEWGLKAAQHNIKSGTPVHPELRPSLFKIF